MEARAEHEKVGTFYFHLSEMFFASLAYEAYLNFILRYMVPDTYERERGMGLKEKLRAIEREVGFVVDHTRDPYATVAWHEQFRDFLAHGKTEEYVLSLSVVKNKPEFPFNSKLEQWVTVKNALSLKTKVFELCREIHQIVLGKADRSIRRRLGDGPFSSVEEVEVLG
jgi:hypothetical protein